MLAVGRAGQVPSRPWLPPRVWRIVALAQSHHLECLTPKHRCPGLLYSKHALGSCTCGSSFQGWSARLLIEGSWGVIWPERPPALPSLPRGNFSISTASSISLQWFSPQPLKGSQSWKQHQLEGRPLVELPPFSGSLTMAEFSLGLSFPSVG